MPSASSSTVPALGFLTVWNKPNLGHIGGYLLLNAQARPLEFHCTAPVVPNRAQEILYGLTLQPYLYGEQIGVTLVARAKQPPRLLVTDCPEVLQARDKYELPMLFVRANDGESGVDSGAMYRFTLPQGQSVGGDQVAGAVAANYRSDQDAIEAFCREHADGINWLEPFERIREAISEAQRPAA